MYIEPAEHAKYPEFETSNRDFENFLFDRGIHWHRQYRAKDCMTYWVYRETPEFTAALDEYRAGREARVAEKRRKYSEAV